MSELKKSGGKSPNYPLEVKQAAIDRAEAGEKIASIAAELGCRRTLLYSWWSVWRQNGGQWPESRPRLRRRPWSSSAREVQLERLVGQQKAELDFLREALRRIEEVGRPTVGRAAASPGSSSRAGRTIRKAS
jgi:transposase-like protein